MSNKMYDSYKKIRKDWGNVNPITKTIEDKTKYNRKRKYKKDYKSYETEEQK